MPHSYSSYVHAYIPSSSCLETTVLGISIIGVMIPNAEETLLDDLGKLIDDFVPKSFSLRICASITKWFNCGYICKCMHQYSIVNMQQKFVRTIV